MTESSGRMELINYLKLVAELNLDWTIVSETSQILLDFSESELTDADRQQGLEDLYSENRVKIRRLRWTDCPTIAGKIRHVWLKAYRAKDDFLARAIEVMVLYRGLASSTDQAAEAIAGIRECGHLSKIVSKSGLIAGSETLWIMKEHFVDPSEIPGLFDS